MRRTKASGAQAVAQQVRTDIIGSVAYAANNKQTIELPRGGIVSEYGLRLTGTPTLTTGNNTLANTLRGDEGGCIDRIELVANGSEIIRTYSWDELYWYNFFVYGGRPATASKIGDGTANPAFDSFLLLPFALPSDLAVRGVENSLNTAQYSKLQLDVYWKDYTGINASASAWTANPSLEVSQCFRFGNRSMKWINTRNTRITETPAAANGAYDIKLPVTRIYRSFLINAQNSSNVDASGIITTAELRSGPTLFEKYSEGSMRSWYRARRGTGYGFERGLNSGTGGNGAFRQSAKSANDGWFYVDLVRDGYQTESLDTLGFSELLVRLNVSAACTIKVLAHELVR